MKQSAKTDILSGYLSNLAVETVPSGPRAGLRSAQAFSAARQLWWGLGQLFIHSCGVFLTGGIAGCLNWSRFGAASMSILIPMIFLSGAVLGLKFKLFALVPAMALTALVVPMIGMALAQSLSSVLLGGLLALVALQIGYVGGILARYTMTEAQTRAHRKTPFQVESLR
jgi:hypothetical protein